MPVRTDNDATSCTYKTLHEIALRSILLKQSNWPLATTEATPQFVRDGNTCALAIGTSSFIPRLIARETGFRVTYLQDFELLECRTPHSVPSMPPQADRLGFTVPLSRPVFENDIAIIGMACRFPGANSLEELWQLLCAGSSMHQELPSQRFSAQNFRTTNDRAKFWGNFLDEVDAFDHRFFEISSREAASTDPQQRLLLQVAYETIESSGYFDELSKSPSVGCFLGVGSVDDQDNVAAHPATAFSALGTLRAFISGKISHHFGWTGPAITYDTACSSSAVAVHSACKAIQSGECSTALTGGVNIITSPTLYQNLDKAGFLSSTGPSRAFDASADGYCRGEGAGLVFLKRLSTAIADGDLIAAVIAGSSVNQSDNCTLITVPCSQSQSDLYRKLISISRIDPMEISFVEAHGTGTPIGDPIECESIRQVFGGPQRSKKLYFGSIKANIGHTEAASGVAALIKAALMIQKAFVPMQANFTQLNSKIPPLLSDQMEIPATTQKWIGSAICLNNYGAAGSNAAMIVCQPPTSSSTLQGYTSSKRSKPLQRYPILLFAHSTDSLRAYCVAFREFLNMRTMAALEEIDVASVAFNSAHRTNPSLGTSITTTVSSLSGLSDSLSAYESGCVES